LAGSFPTAESAATAKPAAPQTAKEMSLPETATATAEPVSLQPTGDNARNLNAINANVGPIPAQDPAAAAERSFIPREEATNAAAVPATEPITRPQAPAGFAPTTAPSVPLQTIPTQPLSSQTPAGRRLAP